MLTLTIQCRYNENQGSRVVDIAAISLLQRIANFQTARKADMPKCTVVLAIADANPLKCVENRLSNQLITEAMPTTVIAVKSPIDRSADKFLLAASICPRIEKISMPRHHTSRPSK